MQIKAQNYDYDVVVVGSGFGGSVMAYRLAAEGLNVAVIERGRRYPPGSFPRTPHQMRRSFWDPGAGLYGMFDVWSFDGLGALVASGVGGGSLIYANVLIRKPKGWFEADGWPVTYDELEPHYHAVERVLKPQPFPQGSGDCKIVRKTQLLRQAVKSIGGPAQFELPPLAVTFKVPGQNHAVSGEPFGDPKDNLHGRSRQTCRLCGECDLGCNYGAKNTLDYNYLPMAVRAGATLLDLTEVVGIAPLDGAAGYRVWVRELDPARPAPAESRSFERCRSFVTKRLVLAAGALGTPLLLMRNRQRLVGLNQFLGKRFSGNGDYLGFIRELPQAAEPSVGPVITGTLAMRAAADGGRGRGFYIQEGGYPALASWLMASPSYMTALARALGVGVRRLFGFIGAAPDTHLGKEMAEVLDELAPSAKMQPLLGMGRDLPNGEMVLQKDQRLNVCWDYDASKEHFEPLVKTMGELAEAMGGTFDASPLAKLNRTITVHPLGGCPIGRSAETGFADTYGQVFGQPGLYVADGSVMPGPVGPNPSLTIAALADRFADGIIAEVAGARR